MAKVLRLKGVRRRQIAKVERGNPCISYLSRFARIRDCCVHVQECCLKALADALYNQHNRVYAFRGQFGSSHLCWIIRVHM